MRLVRIFVVILAASLALAGQTNKGSITGSVTDPQGAAVPGATITITNVNTQQSVTVTTSRDGIFAATTLEPVQYNVTIEAKNFKKVIVEKVKVDTASSASVNVVLELGSVSEEVTIQADSQLVNTDSGTLSQTITERQLRDLPLNNRSVLDLAVTMPNVSGDTGSEDIDAGFGTPQPGFNLSINGGRPGSTSMLADGVNNTGVGLARAVVSFSPETVQEFTVQSSAYSAEFGTTGGGVINITTKSGAREFFGTALWYHRNPKTNARAWNQGTAPRPANNLRSNQLSFTVGGPIYFPNFGDDGPAIYDGAKRGSFFFFAVEPRWRNDFTQSVGLVPTDAERSGNFRDMVVTGSGWLPRSVATQFGLTGLPLPNAPDNFIYQQFTVGPGGRLDPILVPTVAGNQYCPFGSVASIPGFSGPGFNTNGLGQPYCTTAQAQAQIDNRANNPALNVIPSAFFDPVAQNALVNLNPPGSYFLDNGLVRNFFNLREATQNEQRYTVRIDHNITEKMKATFRWTKTPAVGIRATSGSDINGNNGIYSDAVQYLFTLNNVITSNMTNEARFNVTKGNFSEDYSPEFSIMGGRNYSTEIGIRSLTGGGLPQLQVSNDGNYAAPEIGSGASTNNFNEEKRFDISDTFYWTTGNMVWKIGGNWNRAKLGSTPFFASSGGRWAFRRLQTSNVANITAGSTNNTTNNQNNGGNSLASFLIGVPLTVDTRPTLLTYNYQWDSFAGFVQNDWKIGPNFTLNLGMRYAVQLPRTEDNNLQGVFRPDLALDQTLTDAQRRAIATAAGVQTTDAIPSYVPTTAKIVPFAFSGRGGRSRHIVPTDWNGWEPRFGFAWSPNMKVLGFESEKYSFVVRGGFGISHFPINGNNRSASPDFGGFTTASTLKTAVTTNPLWSTGADNSSFAIRLNGNNPVQGTTVPLDTLLGTDANGLVFNKAVVIPGIAVDINDPKFGKVPTSWSWNLAIQFEPFKNSTIEVAYAGNRGVNLYTPQININQRNTDTIGILTANNINPAGGVADPLGRTPLLGGTNVIQTQVASLFSDYLGYEPLNKWYNANSSSIRHAGYVDFRRRVNRGLSLTANYTYAKSMDDSSDSSPDVRVLTSGSVRGQVALGGDIENDWALSAFDTRHAFSATFMWDLPFGKGRDYLKNAPWYIEGPLGGWSFSGVGRVVSGNPFQPFITDPNLLGGALFNRVVRPDIVDGVPLRNPLWDPSCRVGSAGAANGPAGCEPYVNPAAFRRPAKGQLGNAARTLTITEPMRKYFDLSIQKDFPMPWIGDEGRRRINIRVDAINLFNIPNFYFNSRGNTPFGFGTFPVEFSGNECIANTSIPTPSAANCPGGQRTSVISAGDYDTWANFNGRPLSNTPAGQVLLGQIRNMVNTVRLAPRPGQPAGGGALPDNFFSLQVPEGFATANALSRDITTMEGFQLWRLRGTYDGNFGSLTSGAIAFGSPNPGTSQRYIQFGVRLIF